MHALAAIALLLAQAGAGDGGTAPPGPAGKIAGKVTLSGLGPKLANLPVTRDMKICGTSKPDPALEVGTGGGVKNAVVWIVEGPKPKKGDKPKSTLDQKGCEFSPHVTAMPAGGVLEIINSDKLFHNVHAREGETNFFNYAMPVPNQIIPKPLPTPAVLRITCDVHPWMRAWVQVLPTTAWGMTDESGSYTIADVPPGKYTLKLWHERLGEKTQEIVVASGQTATADVVMTPR
jgi:hypothetical protein